MDRPLMSGIVAVPSHHLPAASMSQGSLLRQPEQEQNAGPIAPLRQSIQPAAFG